MPRIGTDRVIELFELRRAEIRERSSIFASGLRLSRDEISLENNGAIQRRLPRNSGLGVSQILQPPAQGRDARLDLPNRVPHLRRKSVIQPCDRNAGGYGRRESALGNETHDVAFASIRAFDLDLALAIENLAVDDNIDQTVSVPVGEIDVGIRVCVVRSNSGESPTRPSAPQS